MKELKLSEKLHEIRTQLIQLEIDWDSSIKEAANAANEAENAVYQFDQRPKNDANEYYIREINSLKEKRDYFTTLCLEQKLEKFGRSLPSREAYPEKWTGYIPNHFMLTPVAIEEVREQIGREERAKTDQKFARLSLNVAAIAATASLLAAIPDLCIWIAAFFPPK